MSPQLGGLGTKYQELDISFSLVEVETIQLFKLRDIQIRSEFSCCKIKEYKSKTSQVNTSCNFQN